LLQTIQALNQKSKSKQTYHCHSKLKKHINVKLAKTQEFVMFLSLASSNFSKEAFSHEDC
jgi:hypothetical protein